MTNLTTYTQFIVSAITAGLQVDVIYTDFSKAFDRVDIDKLIAKVEGLGVPGELVAILESYLMGRACVVSCNGCLSEPYYPTSGVPQESNLGPLLFNIFINDISDNLRCKSMIFADDAKLYSTIRDENDVQNLQSDIDTFASWCKANGLDLNPKKCKKMSFSRSRSPLMTNYTIDGTPIENVQICCDLGVTFDSRLTFTPHIDNVIASASKTLAFITRVCRNFDNTKVMRTLFLSIVRPKLEYAAFVWSPIFRNQIDKIEAVNRKFLKFLCWKLDGVYPIRGCDLIGLTNRFDLLTLEERRVVLSMLFVIKLIRGSIECSEFLAELPLRIPTRRSRHRDFFYMPPSLSRLTVYRASPLFRACDSINKLIAFSDNTLLSLLENRISNDY